MKRIVKTFSTIVTTLFLVMVMSMTVFAEDANVTYSGDAGEFVFAPGSDYSLTDLFPNFKDVMPGDSISQKITVKNNASRKVKVKIYLRSLGAHEDGVSPEFLSQMNLRVKLSEDNTRPELFEAAPNEKAQLTEWVCLGTFSSGGEVNLDLILDVPVEMDNDYAHKAGYLDWEFKVEEFRDPKTGDDTNAMLWLGIAGCTVVIIVVWIILRKKEQDKNK